MGRTVVGSLADWSAEGQLVVRLVRMAVQVCGAGSIGGIGLSCRRSCLMGLGLEAQWSLIHLLPKNVVS